MAHNAGVCAVPGGSPTIPQAMAYTQNYAPFLFYGQVINPFLSIKSHSIKEKKHYF
jgi:hypothetical protein